MNEDKIKEWSREFRVSQVAYAEMSEGHQRMISPLMQLVGDLLDEHQLKFNVVRQFEAIK